jgi:hypothetical protein
MRRFARKRKRAEGDAPAETTTAPAPTARLHLGDCDSRPAFAGPPIPSKHDHVLPRCSS